MLKTKQSANWVEDVWVFHLGSRSTVSQVSLRTWLHKSCKGGVGKWTLGQAELKSPSFLARLCPLAEICQKRVSQVLSVGSWREVQRGIRTVCDGSHIWGMLKLCCGYQVPALASPWFPHLKNKTISFNGLPQSSLFVWVWCFFERIPFW